MNKIIFPLLFLFLQTASAQIPSTGLIAHYSFCGNANDISGNGHHGAVNGAMLSSDRFGNNNNAYFFNGVSDFIDLPVSSFQGLNAYSYSIWFKPVTTNVSLVYSVGSNDPYCQSLSFNSNQVSAGSYNQGSNPVQSYVFSPVMTIVNMWTHVVVTRDMTSIKLFVNGVQTQVLSTAATNNQQASYGSSAPYKAVLGTRSTLNQYFFEGYIDDVRIYSSILTQNDVNALYNESQTVLSVNSGSICESQAFTITPSGAGSYTFSSGSSTVSPLTNTTYTVFGKGTNGCVYSAVSSVVVYPAPTLTISGKNSVCNGQSTSLMASGAVNYTWSTGSNLNTITVTPTGTLSAYSVTYTNIQGCVYSAVSSVAVHPAATISISGKSTVCEGQSTTLAATGAVNYTWSTGSQLNTITVTPTATLSAYSVTFSNIHGCVDSAFSNITLLPAPSVTLSGQTNICKNQSTTLLISGAANYTWSNGSNMNKITVNPTASSTTYSVTYSNEQGCEATSQITVNVENCTSVSEPLITNFRMWTSIDSDHLKIEVMSPEQGSYILVLYDLTGKMVQRLAINSDQREYIISESLESGIYIGQLTLDGQVLTAKKLVLVR